MGKEAFSVTPWQVEGSIDYEKLMKEFGIKHLPDLPPVFKDHVLFRRKVVFAHRDFEKILECIKNKKKFVMMTGLMPSGKFHLGHMLLAQQMAFYQSLGAHIYIAVADLEAYNARQMTLAESRTIALEQYILNYLALGVNPKKCHLYFQSARSTNASQSNAYYRLASNFSRYATFNEFKSVYGEISPGKLNASLIQASDMYHPQLPEFEGNVPTFIPVGIDQDPHIRIARDMASRCKDHLFTPIASTYHVFLPSLKGQGKMSSSDETSYIAMTDTPDIVKKKIYKYAFSGGKDTLEEHRKHGGNPETDISFQYLRMAFETDDKKLLQIEKAYRSGNLLSGELKSLASEKINVFLKEHHVKRKKAEKQLSQFTL